MTIDLDKLREAAKRASPGPWHASIAFYGDAATEFKIVAQPYGVALTVCEYFNSTQKRARKTVEANADFLAAADPSTVLALIERAEKAEAALKLVLPVLADEHECRKYSFGPDEDEEYIRPVREAEEAVREALRDRERQ